MSDTLVRHAGPGRPREFDIDEVLDKAARVFLAHGYHGASMVDLLAATGLARGSLYKAFSDKRDLFRAVFDRYAEGVLSRMRARLSAPNAREGIADLLAHYAAISTDGPAQRACLINIATSEQAAEDRVLAGKIARLFERMTEAIAATVSRGQAAGDIRATTDPAALGRMLLATLQGMRVMGRSGLGPEAIDDVRRAALACLD
jgi:TetR/AcrR family transcriptional repressor of nem operon